MKEKFEVPLVARITSGEHAGLFVVARIRAREWHKKHILPDESLLAVASDEVFVLRKGMCVPFCIGTGYVQAKLRALGLESELVVTPEGEFHAEIEKLIAERNLPTVSNPQPHRD